MFDGKTLVALGCSHTYGEYLGDIQQDTCHERSWVKKLERVGNFKDSVNLSFPGGSNNRSQRLLLEYLKNNDTSNLVVIFTITQLSRHEVVRRLEDGFGNTTTDYINLAAWMTDPNVHLAMTKQEKEFIKTYYVHFTDDGHDNLIINQQVLLLHTLLKSLNIEHYFLEMIAVPNTIQTKQLGFDIPFIEFKNKKGYKINAQGWMTERFAPGVCYHFNHDANQALAEYIYDVIK